MPNLEIILLIHYNDDRPVELIEYDSETYSKDIPSEMRSQMAVLQTTIEEFVRLGLLTDSVLEIEGQLLYRTSMEEVEILESFGEVLK